MKRRLEERLRESDKGIERRKREKTREGSRTGNLGQG